jgi:hypothetical protein
MNDRERFIMEIERNGHTVRESSVRRIMRLIALVLLTGAIVVAIAIDALLATAQAAPARQAESAAAGPVRPGDQAAHGRGARRCRLRLLCRAIDSVAVVGDASNSTPMSSPDRHLGRQPTIFTMR